MREMRVVFKGKVQGVGFRWTVVEHAEALGIKGTVQNLPNGNVEVIAQAEEGKLREFVKNIQKSPGNASIQNTETHLKTVVATFHASFQII